MDSGNALLKDRVGGVMKFEVLARSEGAVRKQKGRRTCRAPKYTSARLRDLVSDV